MQDPAVALKVVIEILVRAPCQPPLVRKLPACGGMLCLHLSLSFRGFTRCTRPLSFHFGFVPGLISPIRGFRPSVFYCRLRMS